MKKDLIIYSNNADAKAINQIHELCDMLPFENAKVRIMPDVHVGVISVVGFTSTMNDKVIPNVIGVDIGCGVLVIEMGKVDIDLKSLDEYIRNEIPYGAAINKFITEEDIIKNLRCYKELNNLDRITKSCGSLGGGNHFIEIDQDEENNKYLIIHSGSRNLGLQVAKIYQKKAIDICKNSAQKEKTELISDLVASSRQKDVDEELRLLNYKYQEKTKVPDDYCYLFGLDMENYMFDLRLTQKFATLNRKTMAQRILNFLGIYKYQSFESIHNYIDDKNIIRKGAIQAHIGQKLIIPINMKDGCIIGVGKGNEDWNCSAPHGAGRMYSRKEIKEYYSLEDYQKEMEGIYTSSVNENTLDESPMAYKPLEEIASSINDTIEIIKIIKPIYNFKAGE